MLSLKHAVPLLLLSLILGGCTVQYENVQLAPNGRVKVTHMTPELQKSIQDLEAGLIAMQPGTIDPREAREIAYDAHVYPMYLANDWDLTWPPLLHNTLRNADQRKAGLCVDWARAMRARMRSKNLTTFDLYWGVAHKGNPWREHSTLIVTPKGRPMDYGMVLDPWRDSGKLYWSRVKDDIKYPWKYFEGPG
ncbi:MAG: hypothetical protein KJ914_08080 [Gammaproteobacteria bacterium]|nr:hypothetical protein [Gammaproteobacteria bacterium]MBU1723729.1 hypothetical protein [Gammaproteobacteria bacterium]MBU2004813.1 hypothetical protein [Gammaproteobacteria bacterium]